MVDQLPDYIRAIESVDTRTGDHVPDRRSRKFVKRMIIAGATQGIICELLNIAPLTLTTHYKVELQAAHIANQRMAQVVFAKGLKGDITAAIFWLRSRAHWRDRDAAVIQDTGHRPYATVEERQLEDALTKAISNLRPVAEKQQHLSHDSTEQ